MSSARASPEYEESILEIMSLFNALGGGVWTAVIFIIALSVIVAIHEYGHYIVGRWSGIHADVFSLGFGPVIFARTDKHGTQWQIALLPLGGFVKFAGDADAASAGKDDEAFEGLNEAELRRTMHGAPLWARAATVAAGPMFNFALSIIVFFVFFMFSGKAVDPVTVGEIRTYPQAETSLLVGDQIRKINGQTPPEDAVGYRTFIDALPKDSLLPYTVGRGDEEIIVMAPHPSPPAVSMVAARSAARTAGMQIDDVITAVDGQPVASFDQMRDIILASEGQPVVLDVWRGGETLQVTLSARERDHQLADGSFEKRWQIGLSGGVLFTPAREGAGIWESASGAVQQTWAIISGSLEGLYHIFVGTISTCNLNGPVGMAQNVSAFAEAGIADFIRFIALLSTAVGLLNLFPIPVLDGGHLVFFAWEAVTGKPPSEKALRILMSIGLTVMLLVMTFALGNDLLCK